MKLDKTSPITSTNLDKDFFILFFLIKHKEN